jgi:hypothetical protein
LFIHVYRHRNKAGVEGRSASRAGRLHTGGRPALGSGVGLWLLAEASSFTEGFNIMQPVIESVTDSLAFQMQTGDFAMESPLAMWNSTNALQSLRKAARLVWRLRHP